MPNLMDSIQYDVAPRQQPMDLFEIIERAKQDPLGFEEKVKQMNPEGYQRALQIRNSANPRAIALQMAQAQGVNPNILRMLGYH